MKYCFFKTCWFGRLLILSIIHTYIWWQFESRFRPSIFGINLILDSSRKKFFEVYLLFSPLVLHPPISFCIQLSQMSWPNICRCCKVKITKFCFFFSIAMPNISRLGLYLDKASSEFFSGYEFCPQIIILIHQAKQIFTWFWVFL